MPNFVITYLGGDHPQNEEEQKQHFQKYQEWLGSLGDAAVKPMVPYKNVHVVKPDGTVTEGSSVAMTGHTIVSAPSIAQAIETAKSCPFLEINGTLEVSEIVGM